MPRTTPKDIADKEAFIADIPRTETVVTSIPITPEPEHIPAQTDPLVLLRLAGFPDRATADGYFVAVNREKKEIIARRAAMDEQAKDLEHREELLNKRKGDMVNEEVKIIRGTNELNALIERYLSERKLFEKRTNL